jgi:hypothetical protein
VGGVDAKITRGGVRGTASTPDTERKILTPISPPTPKRIASHNTNSTTRMWREYVRHAVDLAKLGFWFIFSRREFRLLRATMELKAAVDAFAMALRRNADMQNSTRETLNMHLKRAHAIDVHLQVQLSNWTQVLMGNSRRRGAKGPTAQEVLDKLSQADRDLLSEAQLLQVRIRVSQRHLESLQHIECRLQESHESCANHYASISLASHVSDIAQIVDKIKVDGLTDLVDRLVVDVDRLVSGASEVTQQVDAEAREVDQALSGLNMKTRGAGRLLYVTALLEQDYSEERKLVTM